MFNKHFFDNRGRERERETHFANETNHDDDDFVSNQTKKNNKRNIPIFDCYLQVFI